MVYYKAKHILLEDEEDALELRSEILGGAIFEDLAMEFSECDSSIKGGHLGRFKSGTMLPEFERALYHMKVDELSMPVKTKFGYHLIYRIE
jgi:parvulin-like peptidyl-prolyl isomerase